MRLLVAIAAVSVPPPAAYAPAPTSPRPRVVVQPLRFEGQLQDAFRERVEAFVVDGLRRSQYEVVASTHAGGSDYVVRGALTTESRNYTIHLEIADPDGEVVAQSEERCELCGIGEVESMVADQAASLSDKLASLIAAQPLLIVRSNPTGATVVLDGEDVGMTPLEVPLRAGRHTTRARLPGYFQQELEVDAVQGMRQAVVFQLVAEPPPTSARDRQREKVRPWGFASLVVGVASLAGGGALLGLDERPYRRHCSGADVDAQGDCRLRYDTLAGGIAATVTGAALTITGAALLGFAYRKRKGRREH